MNWWNRIFRKKVNRGIKVVWGVPTKFCPVIGLPAGRVRFRFRNTDVGRAFVRPPEGGLHHFALIDNRDGTWGLLAQGMNLCPQSEIANRTS